MRGRQTIRMAHRLAVRDQETRIAECLANEAIASLRAAEKRKRS